MARTQLKLVLAKGFLLVHVTVNSRDRSYLIMAKSTEDGFPKENQGYRYQEINKWILGSLSQRLSTLIHISERRKVHSHSIAVFDGH